MDRKVAKEVISVIRTERQARSDRLKNEDSDFASDQWLFTDEPFINDMCLLVLVALRHQVERELVFLAASSSATVGTTITRRRYQENVSNQRKELRKRGGWDKLIAMLDLETFAEWTTSMETLRLLANCIKHEPTQEPDEELLKHLKLPLKPLGPLTVSYMPLPESKGGLKGSMHHALRSAQDADYSRIKIWRASDS